MIEWCLGIGNASVDRRGRESDSEVVKCRHERTRRWVGFARSEGWRGRGIAR